MPTPEQHCRIFLDDDLRLLSAPPGNRVELLGMVSSDDTGEWFPIAGRRGWEEAWFQGQDMLKACIYRRRFDTCDNDSQAATFTRKNGEWTANDIFEISVCTKH